MFPVSKGDTVFHSVLQRCSKLQSPISQKRTGAMKNICQNLLIYTQQCSCHSPLQEEAVCVCLDTQWCLSLGCPMDRSPHKNPGVGCRTLFQRIFPAQGSNPGSLESPALAGRFLSTSATWGALQEETRLPKVSPWSTQLTVLTKVWQVSVKEESVKRFKIKSAGSPMSDDNSLDVQMMGYLLCLNTKNFLFLPHILVSNHCNFLAGETEVLFRITLL